MSGHGIRLADPDVRPVDNVVPGTGQRTGRRPQRRFPDLDGRDDRRSPARPRRESDPRHSESDCGEPEHRIDIVVIGQRAHWAALARPAAHTR